LVPVITNRARPPASKESTSRNLWNCSTAPNLNSGMNFDQIESPIDLDVQDG